MDLACDSCCSEQVLAALDTKAKPLERKPIVVWFVKDMFYKSGRKEFWHFATCSIHVSSSAYYRETMWRWGAHTQPLNQPFARTTVYK
jgi:hypothetical protein